MRRAFVDEWRRMLSDSGAMLVLIGAILIYAAFYPLPYTAEVLKDVPVSVVDLDRSTASRTLATMIDAHELLCVVPATSFDVGRESVRRGETFAVAVIPAGFERDLKRGGRGILPLYVDTAYFLTYRQVLTGFAEAAGTYSAGVELRRAGLGFATRGGMRDPVRTSFRPLFNATESYRQYVVPAVLVLILQQTLLVGIGMLRAGTRRRETLAETLGAASAYFTLYCVHSAIYFAIIYRLYDFPQRSSLLTLGLVTALFLLAVIFLGLFVASLFSRREAAIPVVLVTSLPALFLAGFAWPVESMPFLMRALANLLPSTHAITAVNRLAAMGAPLSAVAPQLKWMAGLAVAYALCGSAFRRVAP